MSAAKVTEIFALVMDLPEAEVDGKLTPETVANWDSLTHMTLINALEDSLAIRFSEDAIASMTSVAAIAAAVEALQNS
jgi:acyl carrier protein